MKRRRLMTAFIIGHCVWSFGHSALSDDEARINWPAELAEIQVGKITQYRGTPYGATLKADVTGWKTLILIEGGKEISQAPVGECLRVAMINEETTVPTFCVWGKRDDGRFTRIYLNQNSEGHWRMSHMEFSSMKRPKKNEEGVDVRLEGKIVRVYFDSVFDGGRKLEVMRNRSEN